VAVLAATSELMHEVGVRAMTTEGIASRSGASKATIYRWWPNKFAVAVEAFLSEMLAESPDPDTGSALEDFRLALRGLIRFYASSSGRVFAQLVGEAQFDPVIAAELRDRLVGSRRRLVRAIWDRGAARGELPMPTRRPRSISCSGRRCTGWLPGTRRWMTRPRTRSSTRRCAAWRAETDVTGAAGGIRANLVSKLDVQFRAWMKTATLGRSGLRVSRIAFAMPPRGQFSRAVDTGGAGRDYGADSASSRPR
jgi:AcrR family transcriptional regulator